MFDGAGAARAQQQGGDGNMNRIETARLALREMTPDDLPALREIVQDDLTMAAWNGAWSEEETVEGLEKQQQGNAYWRF